MSGSGHQRRLASFGRNTMRPMEMERNVAPVRIKTTADPVQPWTTSPSAVLAPGGCWVFAITIPRTPEPPETAAITFKTIRGDLVADSTTGTVIRKSCSRSSDGRPAGLEIAWRFALRIPYILISYARNPHGYGRGRVHTPGDPPAAGRHSAPSRVGHQTVISYRCLKEPLIMRLHGPPAARSYGSAGPNKVIRLSFVY